MFFRTLFSGKFDKFVTVKVAGFFYRVVLLLLAIAYGVALPASFISMTSGNEFAGPAFLGILSSLPIAFLLLLLIRIGFETSVALIKIAENTSNNA
jgi:hypothetical protein